LIFRIASLPPEDYVYRNPKGRVAMLELALLAAALGLFALTIGYAAVCDRL